MTSILTEAENFVNKHPQLAADKDYWTIEIGNAMMATSLKVVNELEEHFEKELGLFDEVTEAGKYEKQRFDSELEEKSCKAELEEMC